MLLLLLLLFFLMEIHDATPFLLEILLDIDVTSAVYTCIIEMEKEREREIAGSYSYPIIIIFYSISKRYMDIQNS